MTTFLLGATSFIFLAAATSISISSILSSVIYIYTLVIIAWTILSWFNKGVGIVSDIHNALDKICAPYVNLFRRFIPSAGGLDFSPFIAIIVLSIVGNFVIRFLPF